MKRNLLLTALFAIILLGMVNILNGCKDNEDEYPYIRYPTEEQKQPFIVTDIQGELCYIDELEQWCIKNPLTFHSGGDEGGGSVLTIKSVPKGFDYSQGSVLFSGKVQLHYWIVRGDILGGYSIYSVEVTKIEYVKDATIINY